MRTDLRYIDTTQTAMQSLKSQKTAKEVKAARRKIWKIEKVCVRVCVCVGGANKCSHQ